MHLIDETLSAPVAQVTLACADCHGAALSLKLFGMDSLRRDVKTAEDCAGVLVASGFIGVVESVVGADAFPSVRELVARGEAGRLREMSVDYAPCYCRGCRASYCAQHWRTEMVEDEGFYDCTYGTCPAGHRQLLDD